MIGSIEWVNHASFVIHFEDIHFISDPWLDGHAFNNGWSLLSESKFQYKDFSSITHIWFSHEHPDHFSPSNIAKIPKEYRSKITVFYQKTEDKRIINHLSEMGFLSIIELDPNVWFEINPRFKILCGPVAGGDSWLTVKVGSLTLLNMNDCIFPLDRDLLDVAKQIGKVDILFTQFSYANWVGNRGDINMMQNHAKRKLVEMKRQNDLFKPSIIVPFASYVWFCHEENYYLNTCANAIQDVVHYIQHVLQKVAIVLYPGEVWKIKENHSNESALLKYKEDSLRMQSKPQLVKAKYIDPKVMSLEANNYLKRIKEKNSLIFLLRQRVAKFYITDYQKAFSLSPRSGFKEINSAEADCDISLGSDSLYFMFRYEWGGETLSINGRFQKPKNGNYKRVKRYFDIASFNRQKKAFPSIYSRVKQKLKQVLA